MAKKKSKGPHWFPFDWEKREKPILAPSPSHFVSRNIYEPSVLFDGKTSLMLFRGESRQEPPTGCVGRLGIGTSSDGVHFECQPEPALVPDAPFESYGLAHPRLTLAGGVFILTYGAFDGRTYRLCLATSTDMKHWFRHGPIFTEFEDKDISTTSACIMPHVAPDGRYYMFVGAGDLYLASSINLLSWKLHSKPVLKRKKSLKFASKSIDPGPSPYLTKDGIVVILNGTNDRNRVCVFAALFNADKPQECIANLKKPCLVAEADWERFGYLPNVVRATGLSAREDTFYLYYGGADRFVGVATAPIPQDYLITGEADEKKKTPEKKDPKDKICGV